MVRVTMVNEGPDAFQSAVYGPTITVERVIQQSGASLYRLLDSDGAEKSRRRADLTSMMDQFGIKVGHGEGGRRGPTVSSPSRPAQPSNPVVILDQKSSKDVIQGTNSAKYMVSCEAHQLALGAFTVARRPRPPSAPPPPSSS